MNDIFTKRIDLLIEQISVSASRSRVLLYINTLASFLIFVSVFNFHITWERKINNNERPLFSIESNLVHQELYSEELNELSRCLNIEKNYLQNNIQQVYKHYKNDPSRKNCFVNFISCLGKKQLIISTDEQFKFHAERLKFTIPFLGIVCFIDDIILIGTLGLLMLTVYYFFNHRRTYSILVRLKRILFFIDKNEVEMYYHINQDTNNEYWKKHVKFNLIEIITQGVTNNFVFTVPTQKNEYYYNGLMRSNRIGNYILNFLNYLPLIVISFAFIIDIISTMRNYDYLTSFDSIEFVFVLFFSLVLYVLLIFQSIKNYRIMETNKFILDEIMEVAKRSRKEMRMYLTNGISNDSSE